MEYLNLFKNAIENEHPEIDQWVKSIGPDISEEYLRELALTTQVVIKKSPPNWQHGRILYTKLSSYIRQLPQPQTESDTLVVLETGTARGFSAICLSKALGDSGKSGIVISIDKLPHDYKMYWNSVSDSSGKKTRNELLESWSEERERVHFLTGKSRKVLKILHPSRIHFAFLDGEHTNSAVLGEFRYVSSRQHSGDVIVLDDVTPGMFDGVTQAVDQVKTEGGYKFEFIGSSSRGYAVATKL